MKKVLLGLVLGLVSMGVYAGPASTFSGAINGYADFKVTDADEPWQSCEMTTSLKVPGSKKDLLIGVSLQSGIFTETKVKGQKGATDLASADGSVEVTVLLDGEEVAPGTVIFNSRAQTLEATLGGVLESCDFNTCTTDMDPDSETYGETTCTFTKDDCEWSDEDIRLALDTTSANHFNFIAPNVGNGDHTLEVCVNIAANAEAGNGSAQSWAVVNVGSLSVEVVKAANTDTGITVDL